MSYEFKRLSDVESVETISEVTNVLVEDGGVIKKVPSSEVGGGSITTFYFVSGSTTLWLNPDDVGTDNGIVTYADALKASEGIIRIGFVYGAHIGYMSTMAIFIDGDGVTIVDSNNNEFLIASDNSIEQA